MGQMGRALCTRAGWQGGIGRECRSRSRISRGQAFQGAFLVACCVMLDHCLNSNRTDSRQVIVVAKLLASLTQHLDAFSERYPWDLSALRQFEFFNVICTPHKISLLLVSRIQLLEDEQHQILQNTHHLMVILLKLHFQIKTCEFSEMTGSVGVLGTEYGADFHDALEAGGDEHLLVELRRLSEVGGTVKVFKLKNIGTAFGGRTENLGGMNESEAFLTEEFLELP